MSCHCLNPSDDSTRLAQKLLSVSVCLAAAICAAQLPVELSEIALETDPGGFVVNGVDVSDGSGFCVSGAGDVNGDGLDDVVIGAHAAERDGQFATGEVYVVFGRTNGASVNLSNVAAGIGGFLIRGIYPQSLTGVSVSRAGDVNGDDLDDLILGAPHAGSVDDGSRGDAYVVFGKAHGAMVDLFDVVNGIGGFVITGSNGAYDEFGRSVSGAGDVNGDGYDDVVVGAPTSWSAELSSYGSAYVVFGGSDVGPVVFLTDVQAGIGGFAIYGPVQYSYAGWSVSGAGDVNGDGRADVIVGAPHANPNGAYSGASYVLFGKASGSPLFFQNIALGIGGFAIQGMQAGDFSGISVSGAGDVNGDGLSDVIVGADHATRNDRGNVGESYVVFGKANGAAVNLATIAAGNGGFAIKGIDYADFSGGSVSGAGDVNGDGLDDVIVGARFADPGNRLAAGESYVVFGKSTGTPVRLSDVITGVGGFVINGVDSLDYSGNAVSGAGDVNGDGLGDLIIGAPQAAPGGRFHAGESYIIFSQFDPIDPYNIYVDFAFDASGVGTDSRPFNSLRAAVNAANDGATIHLMPGSNAEVLSGVDSITRALTLENRIPQGGSVTIGSTTTSLLPHTLSSSGFVSVRDD